MAPMPMVFESSHTNIACIKILFFFLKKGHNAMHINFVKKWLSQVNNFTFCFIHVNKLQFCCWIT